MSEPTEPCRVCLEINRAILGLDAIIPSLSNMRYRDPRNVDDNVRRAVVALRSAGDAVAGQSSYCPGRGSQCPLSKLRNHIGPEGIEPST